MELIMRAVIDRLQTLSLDEDELAAFEAWLTACQEVIAQRRSQAILTSRRALIELIDIIIHEHAKEINYVEWQNDVLLWDASQILPDVVEEATRVVGLLIDDLRTLANWLDQPNSMKVDKERLAVSRRVQDLFSQCTDLLCPSAHTESEDNRAAPPLTAQVSSEDSVGDSETLDEAVSVVDQSDAGSNSLSEIGEPALAPPLPGSDQIPPMSRSIEEEKSACCRDGLAGGSDTEAMLPAEQGQDELPVDAIEMAPNNVSEEVLPPGQLKSVPGQEEMASNDVGEEMLPPSQLASVPSQEDADEVPDLAADMAETSWQCVIHDEPERKREPLFDLPVIERPNRRMLSKNDTERQFQRLCDSGDIAGAYWIAWSLEKQGLEAPIPSWLMKTVQGALWSDLRTDAIQGDIEVLMSEHSPDISRKQRWLCIAGSLPAFVRNPGLDPKCWFSDGASLPAFDAFLDAIGSLNKALAGRALLPEDMVITLDADTIEQSIRQAITDLINWRQVAIHKKYRIKRNARIMRHLVGDGGKMGSMLHPLIRLGPADIADITEISSAVQAVKNTLPSWEMSPHEIRLKIDEWDKATSGNGLRPIEAGALNELIQHIQEPIYRLRRLCELEERMQMTTDSDPGLASVLQNLFSAVNKLQTDAEATLKRGRGLSQWEKLALRCLLQSSAVVTRILSPVSGETSSLQDHEQSIAAYCRGHEEVTVGLDYSLKRRLLYLVGVDLDNDMMPYTDAGSLAHLVAALGDTSRCSMTPEEAASYWAEIEEFRFTHELLLVSEGDTNADDHSWVQDISDAELKARKRLKHDADVLDTEVEDALLDGVIGESDRAKLSAAAILSGSIDDVKSIGQIRAGITRSVKAIEESYERWREGAEADLSSCRDHFHELGIEDDPQVVATLSDAAGALNHLDVRLFHLLITELQDAASRREPPSQPGQTTRTALPGFLMRMSDRDWISTVKDSGGAARFAQAVASWVHALRKENAQVARNLTILGSPLSPDGADTLSRGLSAWVSAHKLIESHDAPTVAGANNLATTVVDFFRGFFGFTTRVDKGKAQDTPTVRVVDRGQRYTHLQITLDTWFNAQYMPQFGSQANGTYHVLCCRPCGNTGDIRQIVDSLHAVGQPVIILYFGKLGVPQRLAIRRSLAEESYITAPILDEYLLLHLMFERDRFRAFLECALPFTAVIPYAAERMKGLTHPEMFVGRHSITSSLEKPEVSLVLYGGRHFGKSSILSYVKVRVHNPDQGSYAAVLPVSGIGAMKASSKLWEDLRELFARNWRLIPASTPKEPKAIENAIRDCFKGNQDIRALIMFDEADAFCRSDRKDGYRIIKIFHKLMIDTAHRLRFIITGLNEVRRLREVNDTQSQIPALTPVGPLEPEAALELVEGPLRVLGFHIARTDALRILAYTNSHAGLIQTFCAALLKNGYAKVKDGNGGFPYVLTRNDVDDVYRNPNIRREVRRWFEETIRMDSNYEAIVWLMITEYLLSPSKGYEPLNITDVARLLESRFAARYSGMSNDLTSLVKDWLEELCGMGVLTRDAGSDGFRLRNPNLVRLYAGATDEIEGRILALADASPQQKVQPADIHHPLQSRGDCSPLTREDERIICAIPRRVQLLAASEALGYGSLEASIRGLAEVEENIRAIAVPPFPRRDYLADKLREAHRDAAANLFYQMVPAATVNTLVDRMQYAEFFVQQREANVGVLFLLDAQALWTALHIPTIWEQRNKIVLTPAKWREQGIAYSLQEFWPHLILGATKEAMEVTGGWPVLIQELMARIEHCESIGAAVAAIDEDMKPTGIWRSRFKESLGLDTDPTLLQVISGLTEIGPIPVSEASEMLDLLSMEKSAFDRALAFLEMTRCVDSSSGFIIVDRLVAAMVGQ